MRVAPAVLSGGHDPECDFVKAVTAEEYARRIPGFRAAYFVGDRAANRVHAIFVWDDDPGEGLARAMDDFRQRCRDITTGPAEREDYEALSEA